MNYSDIYIEGKKMLEEAKCENASFDALCIFEKIFNINKTQLIIKADTEAQGDKVKYFFELVERRIQGEPLQYILGYWDFMGLSFSVGKGVLIPRPETEILVDLAVERLKGKEGAVVLDLCAGSGCVGLSVAYSCPNSDVYLIEKSPQAFEYLKQNKDNLNLTNAHIFLGDISRGFTGFSIPHPDIILSNPPYIRADELPTLQKEVRQEPQMALDGGDDGLIFYHILSEKWIPALKEYGVIAVECGEGQADYISQLYSEFSLNTKIVKDLSGIERVVILTLN